MVFTSPHAEGLTLENRNSEGFYWCLGVAVAKMVVAGWGQ